MYCKSYFSPSLIVLQVAYSSPTLQQRTVHSVIFTFLVKSEAEVRSGSAIRALEVSRREIIELNLFDQERPWHVSRCSKKHTTRPSARSVRSLALHAPSRQTPFFLFVFVFYCYLLSFSFCPAFYLFCTSAPLLRCRHGAADTSPPLVSFSCRRVASLSAEMQLQHRIAPFS